MNATSPLDGADRARAFALFALVLALYTLVFCGLPDNPDAEVEFLAGYLFGGPEGLEAARKVDDTIRRLPGFETVALLEAWMDRHVRSLEGRRHGHRND